MDDDLFGSSVWGVPNTSPSSSSRTNIPSQSLDEFDDFSEFDDTPKQQQAILEEDDDFGDFGDFGEADAVTTTDFEVEDNTFSGDSCTSGQDGWEPLMLNPMPSPEELRKRIEDILYPIWANWDVSELTTEEAVREVEGVSQILVTPESRTFYNKMVQLPPVTQPINWTRSRIRRRHLIDLGIPVNLDEMLPQVNAKIPTLKITTRPMSAPPDRRNSAQEESKPRSSQPGKRGLGGKPDLDNGKITSLLALTSESLALLPLVTLERHLEETRTQTANVSTLLTFLLQSREALQQDSETYNRLIGDLVGEAQKAKSGKGPRR